MQKRDLRREIIRKSFLPFLIAALVIILHFVYSVNIEPVLSENIIKIVTKGFFAVFVSTVAFLIQRITSSTFRWYSESIAVKTEAKFYGEFIPLLKGLPI